MTAGETKLAHLARRWMPAPLRGPCSALYCGTDRLYRRAAGKLKDLRWQVSPDGRHNQRRLRGLRNACQGRRCFIIGNGPSLAQTDLSRISAEVTVGCNNLFLMFDRMGFLPTFYTVEDTLVAEDRGAEISRISGTTKVFPLDLAHWLKKDDNTVYVRFLRDYAGFPMFSDRLDRVAYWGGTVTLFNLQLAYYVGCRQVYLVGIDHNYTLPPPVDRDQDAVIVSNGADVNHFDPSYFGQGYRYHNPKVDRMERGYVAARDFAASHGMSIFNATIGGKLEVFPRADYEKITAAGGTV